MIPSRHIPISNPLAMMVSYHPRAPYIIRHSSLPRQLRRARYTP